jgi:hypothetical protein
VPLRLPSTSGGLPIQGRICDYEKPAISSSNPMSALISFNNTNYRYAITNTGA